MANPTKSRKAVGKKVPAPKAAKKATKKVAKPKVARKRAKSGTSGFAVLAKAFNEQLERIQDQLVKLSSAARGKKRGVRRQSARHSRKPNFFLKGLKSQQTYWGLGMFGAVVLVAGGLRMLQSPANPPAPVELTTPIAQAPAAPIQPVAQQPVAQAQPVVQPVVEPPKAPEKPAYSGPLAEEFSGLKSKDIGDRVAFWSDFVAKNRGEKVRNIPGAPAIEDSAPLIPEKFNCTTYVETVAALSRSVDPTNFYQNLLAIRYRDGHATFGSRNHFPEADWLPNNEKAGIVKDVTNDVAQLLGLTAQYETKVIDRATWFAKQMHDGEGKGRAIASVEQDYMGKPAEVRVAYIPAAQVAILANRIPSGTVLNLVRKNNTKQPVLITHQGFVVHEGGEVKLRHALPSGKFKNENLVEYLKRLPAGPGYKSWPLLGINLNAIRQ